MKTEVVAMLEVYEDMALPRTELKCQKSYVSCNDGRNQPNPTNLFLLYVLLQGLRTIVLHLPLQVTTRRCLLTDYILK